MKKIVGYIICSVLLFSACSQPKKTQKRNPFVTEICLKTTPVKDQGRSSLCWLYAMLATIETNHLMQGDSVNLSTDYVARQLLMESARRYYLSRGTTPINMRGMGTRLLTLIQTYGAVPFDAYHAYHPVNYNVVARKLQLASRSTTNFNNLDSRANSILDEAVGYLPGPKVYMLGAAYTPLEFAHSVCQEDEYQAITSFTHHPFGSHFVLEVPDNVNNDRVLNMPLDAMMQFVVTRLRNGRAVFWEGDVSSPGFDAASGIAKIALRNVTQQQRQRAFEHRQTTDDHALALIGIAHDRQGQRYFIAKNSWGTANRFHGFLYLSEDYLRMNTVLLVG